MDGVFLVIDGDLHRRGTRIDHAQIITWDILGEEKECFYRCVSSYLDPWYCWRTLFDIQHLLANVGEQVGKMVHTNCVSYEISDLRGSRGLNS